MRSWPVLITLAACQGGGAASNGSGAPAATPIEVKDGAQVIAKVVAGHPCRATVGNVDMQIGGAPLVAQVGDVKWTGSDDTNGTYLLQNDAIAARILAGPDQLSVFDPEGVALFRAKLGKTQQEVSVQDASGRRLRQGNVVAGSIQIGDGTKSYTVTGTDDLILAAILTASEASPQIRALTACHRVLGGGTQ